MDKKIVLGIVGLVTVVALLAVIRFPSFSNAVVESVEESSAQNHLRRRIPVAMPASPRRQDRSRLPISSDSLQEQSKVSSEPNVADVMASAEATTAEAASKVVAALDAGNEHEAGTALGVLVAMPKQRVLDALRGLVQHGAKEERKNALCVLALLFGRGGAMEERESPENDAERDRVDNQTKDIVRALGEGLEDEESDVRMMAYDAMCMFGEDVRGNLSHQIPGGEVSSIETAEKEQ